MIIIITITELLNYQRVQSVGFSFSTYLFYRQLHFSSQPGVANGFWENEAENCVVVAKFYSKFLPDLVKIRLKKRPT